MRDAAISFPMFGGAPFDLPDSVSVFGMRLYIYGMIIALGLLLATAYALRVRGRFGITQDNILDILIFGVPAGIIGARLYYAIFNFSEYFGPGKWMNIFKLREGGLAIYGGVIFGAVTVIAYSKVKKIPLGALLDILGLGLPIGQSIGRWGNFFNREAYGAATTLPWRMGLTPPGGAPVYVHPTFLYESLWNALGFLLLHRFSRRRRTYNGQVFLLYLLWYGAGRFMIEGLRADSLYIPGTNVRASQLLSGILVAVSAAMLVHRNVRGRSLAELTFSGAGGVDGADEYDAADGDGEADEIEEIGIIGAGEGRAAPEDEDGGEQNESGVFEEDREAARETPVDPDEGNSGFEV
jgi:phosphatidylglycerol:prolipoprotein diacylglycerol transferase